MHVAETQTFLSLSGGDEVVEIATGETDLHANGQVWTPETKSLGQVPTPTRIADMMARWALSAGAASVLDPAAGLGHLLHACRRLRPAISLLGVELDERTMQQARRTAPRGTRLILADYLRVESGPFDAIVANPPYVKAHRLDYSDGDWRYFEERLGTRLDRLTNLYALFLLKIWDDLAPGGRAAIILPAEFLNANFGDEIKDRLQRVVRPAGTIVFSPKLNLFAGALTTSAMIFLDKDHPATAPLVARRVDSLEDAEDFVAELLGARTKAPVAREIDLAQLNPREKWLNLFFGDRSSAAPSPLRCRIGDYFTCSRGIATGANDFFCLSASGLQDHRLDRTHVDPCVTKATDAKGLVFSGSKFDALAAENRRCFLLNPRQEDEALRAYLRIGEAAGIPQRHLPSHRPVWYRPENRAVADIWVAVFSRERVKFILNTSGARNLTCFHGLYARPGNTLLAPLLTLFLNSSWGREAFARVNRFYGDGLNKLEPRDVEAMPCPEFAMLRQDEADRLVCRLGELETLTNNDRDAAIDALLESLVELPARRPR